jgi:glyoxylase-like metal-dependent hydrolase (beta-lactamase superfamily II)
VSGYEVLAVRYGSQFVRKSEAYLNYEVYGEPDGALPMEYFFWVIRDGEGTTLVDCGFDPAVALRRDRTVLVDPVVAMRGLGIQPSTVRRLVITHAHYDHIGNLGAFPAAEIILARREYDFWAGPHAGRTQFAHATEAAELAHLAKAGEDGRLRLVDGTADVAPGLEVVVVGGHTPGQLIAKVVVPGGTVVLAADALHFYEELERDWPFFVVSNLLERYRGFDLLREMTEDSGLHLVAGHDGEVGKRFLDRPPDVLDGLSDLVIRIAGPGG